MRSSSPLTRRAASVGSAGGARSATSTLSPYPPPPRELPALALSSPPPTRSLLGPCSAPPIAPTAASGRICAPSRGCTCVRACVRMGTRDTARVYPPTHLHRCMCYISAHRRAGRPTARDRQTHTPHMDAMRVGLCRCVSACMCVPARPCTNMHLSHT